MEEMCPKCDQLFLSKEEQVKYMLSAAKGLVTRTGIAKTLFKAVIAKNRDTCVLCGRSTTLYKEKWYKKKVKAIYKAGGYSEEEYQDSMSRLKYRD